jgi:hypothetical protein
MDIVKYIWQSLYMIISFILLGFLYISSDQTTRKLIAYILFFIYTSTTSYDMWSITKSKESVIMWILGCSVLFSFLLFALVENKAISTWFYFLTFFINMSLLVSAIGISFLATPCELQLKGITQKQESNNQTIFIIIAASLCLILLLEGYTITAIIVFIASLSIHNHYKQWSIGDLINCF